MLNENDDIIQNFIKEDETKEIKDVSLSDDEIIAKKAKEGSKEQREDEKRKEKELKTQEKIKQENQSLIKNNLDNLKTGVNIVNDRVNPLKEWIISQPTVGGILSLVFILLFFIWAIIPINENGKTRLELLWLTLTDKTNLQNNGTNNSINTNNISNIIATSDLNGNSDIISLSNFINLNVPTFHD